MSGHTKGPGWELNGLRFVDRLGSTETHHIDDFPVYAVAPEMLEALKEAIQLGRGDPLKMIGSWRRLETIFRAAIALAESCKT